MICPNCGKEIEDDSLFCNKCGCKIIKKKVHRESKIKYKKVLFILIFVCIVSGLVGGYSYYKQYKEESNKCIQKEKKIKTKLSEANKFAQSNAYLSAFQTLDKVKDEYDIENKSYDGLSATVKNKLKEYDFKECYIRCLNDIQQKNYLTLESDMGYMLNKYSDKEEVKTNLCNKIISEVNKLLTENKKDANLSLIIESLKEVYPSNNTYSILDDKLGSLYLKDFVKETSEQAKKEQEKNRKELSTKEPEIGMQKSDVIYTLWSKPQKINTTETKYGTFEQWVYSIDKYVYVENGIVTAIQK